MSEFEDKLNAILSSPEAMEQITAIANSLNQSGGEAAPGEPETGLGAVFGAGERELAAALGRIAQRAVAARPRERYPSARAFREAVEQALAGGPEQKENKK